MPDAPVVLAATNIRKRFGKTPVLDDVSIEVRAGEVVALLGASGSGKTTLLRVAGGLERPDAGRVVLGTATVFDNSEGIDVPAEGRNLGFVFQSYALWPHMTVAANVGYGLRLRRIPEVEREAHVDRTLDRLGLTGLGGRYPHELSGGQQQRVALARALAVRPKIVLLDEPLSNLDAQLREEIRYELKELHRTLGVTMIYVTHDQEDALTLATKIALLRAGAVEQVGSPRDLYDAPSTTYVAEFLGRANILECSVKGPLDGSDLQATLPSAGGASFAVRRGSYLGSAPFSVCIRPEQLTIKRGDTSGGVRGISATVEHVSYKGAHLDVECKASTGELIISRSPADDVSLGLRVGEAVTLTWPQRSAVLVTASPRG